MNEQSYDSRTIVYHWSNAALIVAIWILGQTADFAAKGTPRNLVWSTHITLGAILAALWISRLLWRSSGGRKLEDVGAKGAARLSGAMHVLLHLNIAAVLVLGVTAAVAHGKTIWGVFTYPKLIDEGLVEPITEAHEWAANLLLLLALAHALTALAHQFLLRDGVLGRMWPAFARR